MLAAPFPASLSAPATAAAPARPLQRPPQGPHAAAPDRGRRRVIALVGGGAVAAVAPLSGCGSTYPPRAVQAWDAAAAPADERRWILAHALLAPNPHNRQPWLADLRRDGEIALVCDPARLLPHTDPYGRQVLIGCGAFVELAVIAAAERGLRATVEPFPAGEPGPAELPGGSLVARIRLAPDPTLVRDPLFAQIRRRHSHKGEYAAGAPLPAAAVEALQAPARAFGLAGGWVEAPDAVAQIRRITRRAWEQEILTPRTWRESAELLRIGPQEIERHRDGIPLMGTLPRVMSALGLFDRHQVPVRGSSGYDRVMARWAACETGSGYLWIGSSGNRRGAQLAAGRAYVRMHLAATALGIDVHPVSQALQEFAEVRAELEALHALLGRDPQAAPVQMLARVGFGRGPAQPTPRRDLAALIRT